MSRSAVYRFATFVCLSAGLCLALGASALAVPSQLGAPVTWTWVLTGLQVIGLWAAGRGRGWGWMVGSAVQPAWIVYAVLTGQLGFIVGCLVSTAVQFSSYLRAAGTTSITGDTSPEPTMERRDGPISMEPDPGRT